MLFTRQSQINCTANIEKINRFLEGKHITIHQIDFEVYNDGDHFKVIPHTENSDQIFTLPITKVFIHSKDNGSIVKLKFTPRQIDIGGPYLLLLFIGFAMLAGVMLLWYQTNLQTAFILIGMALATMAIMWYRMERGYFDYIRKIKKWIKTNIQEDPMIQ
jgi:hypothetical protein